MYVYIALHALIVNKFRMQGSSHVVCVCVFSSHLFWTSSSLDVSTGVTQEEGHTGFLIHLRPGGIPQVSTRFSLSMENEQTDAGRDG